MALPTITSPSIIYINQELSSGIIQTLSTQLYLTSVMDAATFDANLAADGYYADKIHIHSQRVMVLRQMNDLTNRSYADLVLVAKNGLISVEQNKYGPRGLTLPIAKVYLTALYNTSPIPCKDNDLDDGFVGEQDNDDFEQVVPSPYTDPKYPGTDKSSF